MPPRTSRTVLSPVGSHRLKSSGVLHLSSVLALMPLTLGGAAASGSQQPYHWKSPHFLGLLSHPFLLLFLIHPALAKQLYCSVWSLHPNDQVGRLYHLCSPAPGTILSCSGVPRGACVCVCAVHQPEELRMRPGVWRSEGQKHPGVGTGKGACWRSRGPPYGGSKPGSQFLRLDDTFTSCTSGV